MWSANNNQDPAPTPRSTAPMEKTASPSSTAKLRKIPPIPIHRSQPELAEKSDGDCSRSSTDDADEDDYDDEYDDDFGDHYHYNKNILYQRNIRGDNEASSIILASTLGLNHIRTRSNPLPSPLRFSSSAEAPPNPGKPGSKLGIVSNEEKESAGIEAFTCHRVLNTSDQGTGHFLLYIYVCMYKFYLFLFFG